MIRTFLRKAPRSVWLVFYIIINAVYCMLIEEFGRLYGEANIVQISDRTPVILVLFLLIGSYIFFNVLLFNFLSRIKVSSIKLKSDAEYCANKIGVILAALQALFVMYFTLTGTYVAGNVARDSSLLSYFWVLLPVDVLFIIYYGVYRDSKYFKLNLIICLMSSILRGWTGVFLMVIFFESCRLFRKGSIKLRHLVIASVVLVVGYPVLYFGKLFVRFYAFQPNGVASYIAMLDSYGFWDMIGISLGQVFDRFQLISSSVAVYQIAPTLRESFYRGDFFPFWLEGIHGIALYKIFGLGQILNIGQAIAQYFDPSSVGAVNWNVNPSFIGWFFVLPGMSILNLLYAMLLCFASIVLTKMMSRRIESMDMVWYAWLVFLVPGWYGAFFLFVYALVLFVLLHWVVDFFARPVARRYEV